MTYDQDPPRLRLSGDPSDPFVLALEAARGELPGADQLRAVADRLPLFEVPPASFISMARSRLRTRSMQAAAVALAATVGVSAAVAIRSVLPVHAPPPAPAPQQQPGASAAAPAKRARVVAPARVEEVVPSDKPAEALSPTVPEPPAGRVRAANPAPSTVRHEDSRPSQADLPASDVDGPRTPETETALLGRAHQALASDPARALSLTAQHQREYPSGVLRQESELIAIEALEALGRHTEARASAASFRARYPSSAHLRRLDRLIGEDSEGASPGRQ